MLTRAFRRDLACAGCGKIRYPPQFLTRKLSAAQCLAAADECGAPMVFCACANPAALHRLLEEAKKPDGPALHLVQLGMAAEVDQGDGRRSPRLERLS